MKYFSNYKVKLDESADEVDVFDVEWEAPAADEKKLPSLYISYVREEFGASYDIYSTATDYDTAIKNYKKDIKTFTEWGPDDTYSLELKEVFVTEADKEKLEALADTDPDNMSDEDIEFLADILEDEDNTSIFSIDSTSIIGSIAASYAKETGISEDDTFEEITENDELFNSLLDKWIEAITF